MKEWKDEKVQRMYLFDSKRLAILLGSILGIGILIGFNLAI